MDLKEKIEVLFEAEFNKGRGRKSSGFFTPSRLGKCFRFQIWKRRGEVESNPPVFKAFMNFRIGHMFHKDIQEVMGVGSSEVEIMKDDLYGFCDFVGEDFVVDFKTTKGSNFRKVTKEGYSLIADNLTYALQVACYAELLGKSKGFIVFINKEDYGLCVIEVDLAEVKPYLIKELKTLRKHWDEETLPGAKPRAFYGYECKFCGYKDKCEKYEDDRRVF